MGFFSDKGDDGHHDFFYDLMMISALSASLQPRQSSEMNDVINTACFFTAFFLVGAGAVVFFWDLGWLAVIFLTISAFSFLMALVYAGASLNPKTLEQNMVTWMIFLLFAVPAGAVRLFTKLRWLSILLFAVGSLLALLLIYGRICEANEKKKAAKKDAIPDFSSKSDL